MEGLLSMSRKERERLNEFSRVERGELKLVDAARILEMSYRQCLRVWVRYKTGGAAGLVHRGRGRPSNRGAAAEFRRRVLARHEERYGDFGPTLAAEKLAAEGLMVDHETLRRWLIEAKNNNAEAVKGYLPWWNSIAKLGVLGFDKLPTHVAIPELNNIRRIYTIHDALEKGGFKTKEIEKIMGSNWTRVLTESIA